MSDTQKIDKELNTPLDNELYKIMGKERNSEDYDEDDCIGGSSVPAIPVDTSEIPSDVSTVVAPEIPTSRVRMAVENEKDPLVLLNFLQVELAGSVDSMTKTLNSFQDKVTDEQEYKQLKLMELQGKIHSRRQTGLKLLINSVIETIELQKKVALDLRSPKFQEVIKYFLEVLEETFVEVMGEDEGLKNNFFIQLSNKLDGWESSVQTRLENLKED